VCFCCGLGNFLFFAFTNKIKPSKANKQSVASGLGKNHDEKLNRRDGRGEASKKTVQALNVSFQVKGGDFCWLWKTPNSNDRY
jgi:hypothetical protein